MTGGGVCGGGVGGGGDAGGSESAPGTGDGAVPGSGMTGGVTAVGGVDWLDGARPLGAPPSAPPGAGFEAAGGDGLALGGAADDGAITWPGTDGAGEAGAAPLECGPAGVDRGAAPSAACASAPLEGDDQYGGSGAASGVRAPNPVTVAPRTAIATAASGSVSARPRVAPSRTGSLSAGGRSTPLGTVTSIGRPVSRFGQASGAIVT